MSFSLDAFVADARHAAAQPDAAGAVESLMFTDGFLVLCESGPDRNDGDAE